MTEPRTEAGRRLLDVKHLDSGPFLGEQVAAIETEAVSAALSRLRAVVKGLLPGEECRVPDDPEDGICLVHGEVLIDGRCEDGDIPALRAAVLCAIEEEAER